MLADIACRNIIILMGLLHRDDYCPFDLQYCRSHPIEIENKKKTFSVFYHPARWENEYKFPLLVYECCNYEFHKFS